MTKAKFMILMAVLLVALGSVTAVVAQATTELNLWVFVEAHGLFMQRQAERWNAEHPDRPIQLNFENIEYTQMHDNLLASLLVGVGAPDLADIEISKFATFTKGDIQLIPLDDAVEPYLNDIIATRLAPYQSSGSSYGIDYHLGAYLMYYNDEIMQAAGVNVDDIVTWDDYIEAGKKVTQDTDGDGTPDVYMASIETTGVFSARSIMLMMGGGPYNADGELILDSAENVAALQFLQDLVHVEGIATPARGGQHHAAEHYVAMIEGDYASLWMPQWYMERFPREMAPLEGKVKVRPMPIFEEGGFTTTMGGGTGTAITNQIAPEKVDIAKEFLAFSKLTYEGQVELWTELGFDPFRLDVYDDERLSQPNAFWSGEIPFDYIKAELSNVAPEYTGPFYPEITTINNTTMIYDLIENQISPEEVLANAMSELAAMGG